jgi:heterodisulfide reductase subunit A
MTEVEPVEVESLRIGVFVCHCGLNIAGTVDVEAVVEYARTLPDVVYAIANRYTCADPGQKEIREGIKGHNLNRVVVAACSPRMHEPTFRKTVSEAGLNPFLFEMANIREFCSWAHGSKKEAATEKAKEIVKMAVAKARFLRELDTFEVPVTNKAMVIGGGVAGIHAALDLADMGYKVYLVERDESIGGHMAQLDKTFPTLDCSICIEGPKMVEASRNPNIEIIAFTDVLKVDGYIGNFKVSLRKNPQYVIADNCTGCGECVDTCPIEYPNEWEMNLGTRKAISVPFAQAVPLVYTINRDHCIECFKCVDACADRQAIDFEQKPEEIELEVGTITVATGYDIYKPEKEGLYGYTRYSNVITALELERLVNAAGPTGGEVIRASDGKHPKTVAFIQCVGSRDVNKYEYCSGFCCMYALKNSILLKEHWPDIEVYIFYMDMRAYFKGFEEFYRRARELGINFVRGKPSEIIEDPKTKNLIVRTVDTILNEPIEFEAELVVLSTAAIPISGTKELSTTLHVTTGPAGFFLESHPKLKPLDTPVDGIFLAGACQGPKDIPYSVSQGSGAAARAARILSSEKWEIEPIVAVVDPEKCKNVKAKCAICLKSCPYNAPVIEEGKPARINPAMCHGCGTCVAECPSDAITQMHFTDAQIFEQVRAALEENAENKIMAFLCNWCSYAGADLAGTSRFEYPPLVRAIRVMCSGRVDRDFVLEAFRLGAGMVLVGACHLPTDCHYISGNWKMKARMEVLQNMLEKIGISKERLRVAYISAAEGLIFSNLIKEMAQQLEDVGEEKIKAENIKAKPIIENMLARKGLIEKKTE